MGYRVLRRMMWLVARVWFRPDVVGAERVPRRGPVILAINHLAVIDSFLVALLLPRKVSFLAKAEYFERRAVAVPLRVLGAIPVRREHSRAALASLEIAERVLAAGGVFAIHPEGTRSRDGRLHRGRTGVATMALTSGAPVVPVALIGTDRAQPAGTRLPRPRRVTVRFGAPLDFSRYAGMEASPAIRRAITDEIMSAILDLSEQEYVDRYHERSDAA
ncbi:MAG TPA: lysophospholipid acyltransferase family protein [Actinophytocola sp.]|uniref:lysophospholipid acyltransferase family protein n=1 Tax=Actinophytocola sp. TaxID=1872138 RepID=UPI002DDCB093|nr:lysophospholipid acyltransferase family protein [Actinophytocola sp.]HEV2778665.1 lysophospholipid acyltransferase family protein [Actinophytocola sp.]